VLVHGALEDASILHAVILRLLRDGYPIIVFANPLRGVAVDDAYLRSVLDRIEGSVILVFHAYGGGRHHPGRGRAQGQGSCLRGLSYARGRGICNALSRTVSRRRLRLIRRSDPVHLARRKSGTNVLAKADKFLQLLAADVPKSVAP
jgi:hypothetical protein